METHCTTWINNMDRQVMAIALKEITKWDKVEHFKVPAHTYILNEKGELEAYIKSGSNEYYKFKKPMKGFSKSYRKFKEIELNKGGPF